MATKYGRDAIMGKLGFILLLVGGILLILSWTFLMLDPLTQMLLILMIDTFVTPHIPFITGTAVVNILQIATSLGGFGVLGGAILWYAAGKGLGAFIGKAIVGFSTTGATFIIVWQLYVAYLAGVFSLPVHEIIVYFASQGVSFAAVVVTVIGSYLGAGRKIPQD